tara:strand:+ start:5501 stop:7360 length:1860 start_codon:yes stop_codon:yes gene_type:complete
MCGIAGYYINRKVDKQNILNMINSQRHRGPDGEGYYSYKNFTGGMNRLSINGLSNGDQPLYNENKNIVVFYNGEIYNHLDLRKLLKNLGHHLKTNSDGEVIAHLYEEYGIDFLQYLDGMFALSLYDKKKNKLYLARDGIGEKPLYYQKISGNEIAYASEIKALIRFKKIKTKLNYQSIWDFPTFSWIPEPYTIFENIYSLENGYFLEISEKGLVSKKFFYDNYGKKLENKILGIYDEVKNSINNRLISEVKVGSFLSGGIDSSIVATFASKKIRKLNTYTIGFKDTHDLYHGNSDESIQATEYAKILNTNHKTIMIDSFDFLEALDNFSYAGDQPFAVSSGLGILKISQQANQDGVKVLLSGDCADEIFGGYSWYKFLNRLTQNKNKLIKTKRNKRKLSLLDVNYPIDERISSMRSNSSQQNALFLHYYATEDEKKFFINKDISKQCKTSVRYFYEYNNSNNWDKIDYIKNDRNFYLKNEMLCKLDRMTMANSVEGRVPFASKDLYHLSNHLKFDDLIENNNIKKILKEAFKMYLPKKILKRKKHGFNVPLDYWFKKDWKPLIMHTFSQDSKLYKDGIINKKNIDNFSKFYNSSNKINGHTYLSFVMLNKWMENYKSWK